MKKTLLFAICIAGFSFFGMSQVSIFDYDIASIGASFTQRSDTTPIVLPGTAGTGKVWDFSGLVNQKTTLITAVDPLTLPYGARFVGANIALHEDASINNYYFRKEAYGVVTLGLSMDFIGTGDTVCMIFSNPDTMITFPSVYGTSFKSNVYGNTKSPVNMHIDTVIMGTSYVVPVDSVRIIHHATKTTEMDAEGSLTLSTGTVNALRQITYETSIDSAYGYVNFAPLTGWYYFQSYTDTVTQFIWWTKYAGNAIVRMDFDSTSGNATRVDWLHIPNLGITTESALGEPQVYPNPAQSVINVMGTAQTEICLYNQLGALVLSTTATGQPQEINVESLPRGLYFVRTMNNNNYTSSRVVLQ
jgi:hypothetical protein